MDIAAEMAALGLPTSFVARSEVASAKKNKRKSGPSSSTLQSLPSGSADHIRADETPTAQLSENGSTQVCKFCVRSVRLHTSVDPQLQIVADDVEHTHGIEVGAALVNSDSRMDNLSLEQPDFTMMAIGEAAGAAPLDPVRNVDSDAQHLQDHRGFPEGDGNFEVVWEPVWDDEYQCYYYFNRQTCESTWEVPRELASGGTSSPMGWRKDSFDAVNTLVAIEDTSMAGSNDCEPAASVGTSSTPATRNDEHCEGAIVSPIKQAAVSTSLATLIGGIGSAVAQASSEQNLDYDFRDSETLQDSTDSPLPALSNSHIRFKDNSSSCSSDADDIKAIDWEEMSTETLATLLTRNSADEIRCRSLVSQNGLTAIQNEVGLPSSHSKLVKTRRSRASSGQRGDVSKRVVKYWLQRYSLFGKFDQGVKLDEEGWYSVTPEVIAKHHASRCAAGLVIDAFTGVGGNAIQLALTCNWVVAIDVNPERVEYARHNAEIYGVAHKIEFIVGDFFRLVPFLKADVVFLSPPWGGPEYLQQEVFDLCTMLQPKDGISLFKAAQSVAPNIALFMPRNVDLTQLQELSWLSSPPLPCEAEENYVNGKLKAVTAYYGAIASQDL